jgi:hypothetical protein
MRSLNVDFRIQEGFEGVEKERGRGGEKEREWIPGYGRIVRVQNGWLQILLSSSKTRRNQ